MVECTQDNQCGRDKVCDMINAPKPQCVPTCTTTAQCKSRLGPDGVCFRGHCSKA